jgi:hypothetical protein
MVSQQSMPQALVKEEGCVRLSEPTSNLATQMEMKPKRIPLGRNPLGNVPYWNSSMVLNGQGTRRHPYDAPCCDLGMVLSEQGSSCCILSGAPHRRRVW